MTILQPNFMRANLALAPFWLLLGGELAVEIEGRWLLYQVVEGRLVHSATIEVGCPDQDIEGKLEATIAEGRSAIYVDLVGRIAGADFLGHNSRALDLSGLDCDATELEGLVKTK